jgi:hypothetical protein
MPTSTQASWAIRPSAAVSHYPFLYKGDAEKLQVLFCNYLAIGQYELGRLTLIRLATLRPLAALSLLQQYVSVSVLPVGLRIDARALLVVGWLAGWLVGWLAGWLVGWLAGWLAGWL